MKSVLSSVALSLLFVCGANAGDFTPRALNLHYVNGASPENRDDRSKFNALELEVEGKLALITKWFHDSDAGASITLHDITQGRVGADDDRATGIETYFFVRHRWREATRVSPFADLGTGPIFATRPMPENATRLNMATQLNIGATLFGAARFPLILSYRFTHISNGGMGSRNPGVNVDEIVVGTRVHAFGSH